MMIFLFSYEVSRNSTGVFMLVGSNWSYDLLYLAEPMEDHSQG
jgi:hypothetical protein